MQKSSSVPNPRVKLAQNAHLFPINSYFSLFFASLTEHNPCFCICLIRLYRKCSDAFSGHAGYGVHFAGFPIMTITSSCMQKPPITPNPRVKLAQNTHLSPINSAFSLVFASLWNEARLLHLPPLSSIEPLWGSPLLLILQIYVPAAFT